MLKDLSMFDDGSVTTFEELDRLGRRQEIKQKIIYFVLGGQFVLNLILAGILSVVVAI